jgi:hypothetical protein
MTVLAEHATWILVVAMVGSLIYEVYRATVKAGTSRYDSWSAFVREVLVLYVLAAIVVAVQILGWEWASWLGFAFAAIVILISTFYYNPRVMSERRPDLFDWFEDIAFTGLLFVSAALYLYDALGWALQGGS